MKVKKLDEIKGPGILKNGATIKEKKREGGK